MTPARLYYAFDLVPAFWKRLSTVFKEGHAVSVDHVLTEIERGNDYLKKWCREQVPFAFRPTTDEFVADGYGDLQEWAERSQHYLVNAKKKFAQNADAWVIAFARASECTVVTLENDDLNIRKEIPIPVTCREFDVECIDLFEMMRRLKWRIDES